MFVSTFPYSLEVLRASARHQDAVSPSVAEMAAPHVELIRESGRAGSCVLAGYSYGGVLAFEVAHQLRRLGSIVHAVVLLDSSMPPSPWGRFKLRSKERAQNFAREGVSYVPRRIRQRLSRGRRVAASAPVLGADRPVEEISDTSLEERWQCIDRIWLQALKRYWARSLPCRGFLLRAEDNSVDTPDQDYDGQLGWGRLFKRGLEVVWVPGAHLTIWKQTTLCEAWESCLKRL